MIEVKRIHAYKREGFADQERYTKLGADNYLPEYIVSEPENRPRGRLETFS